MPSTAHYEPPRPALSHPSIARLTRRELNNAPFNLVLCLSSPQVPVPKSSSVHLVEGASDDHDAPNTRAADTMGGALTYILAQSSFLIRFDAEAGLHAAIPSRLGVLRR
jgi:hypothetical protein